MLDQDEWLPEEQAHPDLVQELRAIYQMTSDQMTSEERQVLSRVHQRLAEDAHPLPRAEAAEANSHAELQQLVSVISPLDQSSRLRRRWLRPLSTLAAVLLVGMLVGSFVFAFSINRRSNVGSLQQMPHNSLRWESVSAPGSSGGLSSVSGTRSDDVWAVGGSGGDAVPPDRHTVIEHWNGTKWSLVPSPDAETGSEATNLLKGVAALSANDAWAVGIATVGGTSPVHAFTEHWDGKQWSLVTVSLPTTIQPQKTSVWLNAVAAIASNDVWAVGWYNPYPQGDPTSLLLHWDGSRWNMVAGFPGVALEGVSALASDNIWAVGSRNGAKHSDSFAVALHWNGAQWLLDQDGQAAPDFTFFTAVSAVSANEVWAVGSSNPSATKTSMFFGHWDGKAWSYITSPASDFSSGTGVVARSTDDVWSVGSQANLKEGIASPLMKHWDGHRWTTVALSSQAQIGNLSGIASTGKTIWAVGTGNVGPLTLLGS